METERTDRKGATAVAVRHETELYAPVRAFFEARGYEVKSEVLHCDLVAVRRGEGGEEETVIVELKRAFNLELLLQGIERQRLADNVVLLPDALDEAVRVLAALPQPFTLSAARQALGTTRRVAVPLLELLDRRGLTRRLPDDVRVVVGP